MPEKALDAPLRGYKMGTSAKNGLKCHETILNQIFFVIWGLTRKIQITVRQYLTFLFKVSNKNTRKKE